MVAGLKFLSKKSFNPQNLTNQKRVWEKQQEKVNEKRKIQEREAQLQRERDDEELAKARGDIPKLAFMYDAPPGLEGGSNNGGGGGGEAANGKGKGGKKKHERPDDCKKIPAIDHTSEKVASEHVKLMEIQPSDDDAAAAFRLALAAAAGSASAEADASGVAQDPGHPKGRMDHKSSFGTVLHGAAPDAERGRGGDEYDEDEEEKKKRAAAAAAASLSALERAVGRREGKAAALTLDEQIQRFPALAHAPRAKGLSTSDIGVSFKPLGSQIRNVKCMVCGVWGHSRGDRECKVSGWNPFEQKPATTSNNTQKQGDIVQSGDSSARPFEDSKMPASDEKDRKSGDRKEHRHKDRKRRYNDGDSDDDEDDDRSLSSHSSSSSSSSGCSSYRRERERRRRHRHKERRRKDQKRDRKRKDKDKDRKHKKKRKKDSSHGRKRDRSSSGSHRTGDRPSYDDGR